MNLKDIPPLYRLKEIAKILRSKDGCPWDREQTFDSLKPYLVEETYEVYDAIEKGNIDDIKEELGDLLYQVYAHSEIASETSSFTIDDVAEGIIDKLIRRHPHVFADENITDANGVKDRWERIKKGEKSKEKSILDGVPRHLPALLMAHRIQDKVSHVGFDWEKIDDAVSKLDEEIGEFKEAVDAQDMEKIYDEAGDILFSIVNILRFKKVDAEDALRRTIDKFTGRFKYIEMKANESGKEIDKMTLEEMDRLWDESKRVEI
ncbi:MAG: nucleoside triphosphate pyrophosphohydrolase [Spirochaetes bacterium]|nr:nucleoside triphosphate pyrophosphohydrolase [Spirochaetota bacterium]